MIHGDISADNILIYPHLAYVGAWDIRVKCTGLLANWELAQELGEAERQPRPLVSRFTYLLRSLDVD